MSVSISRSVVCASDCQRSTRGSSGAYRSNWPIVATVSRVTRVRDCAIGYFSILYYGLPCRCFKLLWPVLLCYCALIALPSLEGTYIPFYFLSWYFLSFALLLIEYHCLLRHKCRICTTTQTLGMYMSRICTTHSNSFEEELFTTHTRSVLFQLWLPIIEGYHFPKFVLTA